MGGYRFEFGFREFGSDTVKTRSVDVTAFICVPIVVDDEHVAGPHIVCGWLQGHIACELPEDVDRTTPNRGHARGKDGESNSDEEGQ